jgi:hypothetical protein
MIIFQIPKILILSLGKRKHHKLNVMEVESNILTNKLAQIKKLMKYLLMIEKIKMITMIKK